jgi:hypothetical protein
LGVAGRSEIGKRRARKKVRNGEGEMGWEEQEEATKERCRKGGL